MALKIFPKAFATDPDRLARFQREAQVLASLNHPGIAAIYGLEESDGTRALVLELVEGPTLADRIAQGPIPVDEALPIAKQIAEALEAAHEAGVIHRDLKPANIKVREDGTVKVLDFGLAKALDPNPEGDPSQSPTLTAAATQMGVIMGTAAYMSPEQARGGVADRRSDIWSFGAVLLEMLTGEQPFTGKTVSDTLAFVLTKEPDWAALPTNTPAPLRLLRRCVEKTPKRRLGYTGDALLDIEDARTEPAAEAAPLGPQAVGWRRAVPLVLGLLLVGGGITGAAVWNPGGVLAARLAEDKNNTVLLFEAGPDNSADETINSAAQYYFLYDLPAGIGPNPSPTHLGFQTTLQNGKVYGYPRGTGLGGSVNHHALVDGRGSGRIYDDWAKILSDPTWSYDYLCRFFKKMENFAVEGTDRASHGQDGWLHVKNSKLEGTYHNDMIKVVTEHLGIPFRSDLYDDANDFSGLYLGAAQIHPDGRRSFVATDLLLPTLERTREHGWNNLEIATDHLVTKVIVDGGRAVGVEAIAAPRAYQVDVAHVPASRAGKRVRDVGAQVGGPGYARGPHPGVLGRRPVLHLQLVGQRHRADLPGSLARRERLGDG